MVSLTTQELTSTGHLGWNSTKTQAYVLCASIVCALFMPKESRSYVPCLSTVYSWSCQEGHNRMFNVSQSYVRCVKRKKGKEGKERKGEREQKREHVASALLRGDGHCCCSKWYPQVKQVRGALFGFPTRTRNRKKGKRKKEGRKRKRQRRKEKGIRCQCAPAWRRPLLLLVQIKVTGQTSSEHGALTLLPDNLIC